MKKKFLFVLLSFIIILGTSLTGITLHGDLNEISSNSFGDSSLYNYLVSINNNKPLTNDSLKNIAVDMVDVSDSTKGYILDLSYSTVNKNYNQSTDYLINFTSIKGLELLFTSLDPTYKIAKIDLSGHSLTTIGTYLNYCSDLEILDLSSNKLSSVNLSLLTKLKTVNLANNNFTTTDDIKLYNFNSEIETPFTRNVYLPYNNILGEELNKTSENVKFNFGIQGVKLNGVYETSNTVAFIPYLDGITKITITKLDQEGNPTTIVTEIPYLDNETKINQITISYGKYRIEYPEKDNVVSTNYTYLNPINFEVKVITPDIQLMQNGVAIDIQKYVYDVTTINFVGEGEIHLIIDNEDIKSNSYKITDSGIKRIGYYQIIDGYKSDVNYFTINSKINSGSQFIYILLTFAGFTVLILAGYFLYKNVYLKKILNTSDKKEKF